jgi:hypothetical protein
VFPIKYQQLIKITSGRVAALSSEPQGEES